MRITDTNDSIQWPRKHQLREGKTKTGDLRNEGRPVVSMLFAEVVLSRRCGHSHQDRPSLHLPIC